MRLDPGTAFDLVSRIDDLGDQSSWMLLCGPEDRLEEIAREIALEASFQGVQLTRVEARPLDTLIERLNAATTPMILLDATGGIAGDLGRLLEDQRPDLPLRRQVLVVLSPESAETILRDAPHFSSFIEQIAQFQEDLCPELSPEEADKRLTNLRERMGFSDQEVLDRAKRGQLPSDPEFAEWLALLGRGDLVVRH